MDDFPAAAPIPVEDLPTLLLAAREHAVMSEGALRYAAAALRAHGWNRATAELVARALDFAEAATGAATAAQEAIAMAGEIARRVRS